MGQQQPGQNESIIASAAYELLKVQAEERRRRQEIRQKPESERTVEETIMLQVAHNNIVRSNQAYALRGPAGHHQ